MLHTVRRRWRRGLRWMRCRASRGGIVLGYHRVAACARDPWNLCVQGAHLASQLSVLRERFDPVPLERIGRLEPERTNSKPPVALTFDDAYEDVLTEGLPILERFECPATIFVITGSVGQPYWWDQLNALLGDAPPTRITIAPPGRTSRAEGVRLDTRAPVPPELHRALRSASPSERSEFMGELATMLRVDGRAWLAPGPRAMSSEELGRLISHPLISVGSHTRSHADLASSDPDVVESEVRGSKTDLEEMLGRSVETFSYPHGETSRRARTAVEAAGFSVACAGAEGRINRRSDPLSLPRLWPADVGDAGFRSFIRLWTGE